jgi:hypothetical protein
MRVPGTGGGGIVFCSLCFHRFGARKRAIISEKEFAP